MIGLSPILSYESASRQLIFMLMGNRCFAPSCTPNLHKPVMTSSPPVNLVRERERDLVPRLKSAARGRTTLGAASLSPVAARADNVDVGTCGENLQRHVIITGGNCGIGKATAVELAKQGMIITLACRSKEKGDAACSEISSISGNPNVRAMACDLSSFHSTRGFVKDYLKEGWPLHVLVNNAGIMACPQSYTKDGFEMQLGVNHLGHFLLTMLLLETLVKSSSLGSNSRVVVLASAAERIGSIDFNDLNFKGSRGYNRWIAYGQSKLANCLFSYELSRRCKSAHVRVTSNSMHPGIVDTQLVRHIFPEVMAQKNSSFSDLRRFVTRFLGLKTPEEGASTAIHLASSKKVEGNSGFYFEDSQMRSPSMQAQDPKLALKLWEVSEKLTGTSEVVRKALMQEMENAVL